MNPDKQRIAIAEYCGYKDIAFRIVAAGTGMDYEVLSSGVLGKGGVAIPDYLNDLNAMHDAEKMLKDNHTSQDFQLARYISNLENIVSYKVRDCGWSFALTTATAAQKAEAFLKTIGKWEDST